MALPRLNAAGQQVNCDDSQVKSCVAAVKGEGLEDTQSQGDDSPATPLRFTSSSAAINRSEATHRSSAPRSNGEYKQANAVVQGSFCLFMLWHIKKNDTFVMNMWQLCDNCKRLTKL